MCGNIWHNQGVLYARLFFFKEAEVCFEKAYRYHMNMESIYAAMIACKFLEDEDEAERLAKKYGIDAQEILSRSVKWFQTDNSGKFIEIEKEIDAAGEDEPERLQEILNQWKIEYQKHCK